MQSLSELLLGASEEAYDIRGLEMSGEDAPELRIGSIDLKNCSFQRCSFTDCRFQGTGFENVVFEGCDLSGSSFLDCGMKKVYFRECRMLGTVFSGCVLNQGELTACVARYMNMTAGALKSYVLQDCNFSGGSFARCKCQKTTVKHCGFTRCDFSGAEIGGFDFSDSDIEGVTWSLDGLRNVTVTTTQAIEFAKLLGLNVVL